MSLQNVTSKETNDTNLRIQFKDSLLNITGNEIVDWESVAEVNQNRFY
jgi:hypothetical protein